MAYRFVCAIRQKDITNKKTKNGIRSIQWQSRYRQKNL